MTYLSKPSKPGLSVLKRDGSVQPFDKNKLLGSIHKAGATKEQATLVSDRVMDRLGGFKKTVPSSQLSTLVARSLGRVNHTASGQYVAFRDQKLSSPLARTAAKGAKLGPAVFGRTVLPLRAQTVAQIAFAVSASPQNVSVDVNNTSGASFKATIVGGAAPFSYQWFEGSTIVGTGQILQIRKKTPGAYSFCCKVTDSKGGSNTSNAVTLTVTGILELELVLHAIGGESVDNIGIDERIGLDCGRVKKVGTYITLQAILSYEKTGIVKYTSFYFSPSGTWPEEKNINYLMENGKSEMLYCLDRPGTYEFKVTWPGDAETAAITSNTEIVQAASG